MVPAMLFPEPLVPGRLIRRYKRFLADVRLDDGREVTAHCPNPGAMTGLAAADQKVWLAPATAPGRKLAWSWELTEVAGGHLVGINASRPNGLVAEALAEERIPELAGYESIRREVKYGTRSRVDLLLTGGGRPDCYVEIKNVHLKRHPDGPAEFPDSVTARGARHLGELAEMVRTGHRAVLFYVVQRPDCASVALARDIDPTYGAAFDRARDAGIDVLCYDCQLETAGIRIARPRPVLNQ